MFAAKPFADHPHVAAVASRYYWSVPVVALFGLLNGLLESVGIGLLVPLLSTLLGEGGGASGSGRVLGFLGEFARNYPPHQRLLIIAGVMFTFVLLKGATQFAGRTFSAWIDGRAAHDILTGLSKRLENNSYAFHLSVNAGRLVNIVSGEAWKVSDAVRALLSSISSLANVLVFAGMLFFISWRLALVVCAGALLVRLIQTWTTRRLKRLSEGAQQANEGLAERMLFAIYGARVIRLFGQAGQEHDRFAAASQDVRVAHLSIERVSAVLAATLETLHAALFLVTLLIGFGMGVSLPILVAFLVLLNRMQPHLRMLETSSLTIAGTKAQLREVEWLLRTDEEPQIEAEQQSIEKLETAVEFVDVSYTYEGRRKEQALNMVNFTFEKGCTIALIGHSGSGKSTLINVLCGLLQPQEGAILVNGLSLLQFDPDQWRRLIGIAGQDIDLVEGTIAENIAFGNTGMTDSQMKEAARLAHADEFIALFSQGYETVVGGRGLALSGGQRQRIGIARALGRDPEILILDEATNAIDGLSEKKLFALLQETSANRTTIVISHHLATLRYCDRGVVLRNGRVEEAGPLAQLSGFTAMTRITN